MDVKAKKKINTEHRLVAKTSTYKNILERSQIWFNFFLLNLLLSHILIS